jgi:hypothetical protein
MPSGPKRMQPPLWFDCGCASGPKRIEALAGSALFELGGVLV